MASEGESRNRYAIALYEMVCLRANLDRCVETIEKDRFRELLGVPPGRYHRTENLMRNVVTPALLEVNGLSDISVQIEMVRRHPRARAHAVTLAWWRKAGDEFRDAMQERNRSKVGRMARTQGQGVKSRRWKASGPLASMPTWRRCSRKAGPRSVKKRPISGCAHMHFFRCATWTRTNHRNAFAASYLETKSRIASSSISCCGLLRSIPSFWKEIMVASFGS